ncbi:MAG: cytochrome c4 [Rhodocyclales bacterium]|nr:cytochrome c4 [Rhodocyclales bacterium]
MRPQTIACLLLYGLSLVSANPGATAATPDRIASIASERCEACHGVGGQGNNSMFPKLSGQNEAYLVQQMFNFKSRARRSSVMEPQLADLSGEDIVLLARHFSNRALRGTPASDPQLATMGRKIYAEGNPASGVAACHVCHGPAAHGGQMLPRLAGQHAEYLELQLRRFIERSRTTDQTLMHSVAMRMTDEEIRAVSHYLSGLN